MEKRPLVIVRGKTIEVFIPDGFNLVVNGESMIGNATASEIKPSALPEIMTGIPPGSTPEVIVIPTETTQPSTPAQHNGEQAAAHTQNIAPAHSSTQNFFENFETLRLGVPRSGLQCVNNENSPYCQYTEESKNCYMTFASYYSEDCMYNTRVLFCRDCNDSSFLTKCELCYECVECTGCYNCNSCLLCEQAVESDYCFYCRDIQNCFGCVGLRKKSFHIFNKPYTKEEYLREVATLKKLPGSEIIKKMEPLLLSTPRQAFYGRNNENASGNNIFNCKNTQWAFDCEKLFDTVHVYHCDDSRDLVDCSNLGWSELCYEIMSGGKLTNCNFCFGCWNSNNLEYCDLVYNSHDCFGCVGRNHAEYEILNKKYPKEEYFKRIAEIKDRMKKEGSYGKWFTGTYPEVLTAGL